MTNKNNHRIPIKKKHHYVWAQYLKQWATGSNVWYISSKHNIRFDSIYGLSQKQNFYKVNPLIDEDIAFIRLFPTTNSAIVKKFHEEQLLHFAIVSLMINAPLVWKNTVGANDLAHIAEASASNSLEDTYTTIEKLARPIMNELWNGNADCLRNSSNMTAFCNYLGHQLARTKKLKDATFAGMQMANIDNPEWPHHAKLFEKNWWMISYKMGINFGHSLAQAAATDNHIFIKNETNIDFITSDFPVINIHECAQSPSTKVDKLDLYYPLSPKFAYIISESDAYNKLNHSIDAETVKKLNLLIAGKAHENVYGSSEQALKDVRASFRR